jgi:hypothetical protein
MLFILLRIGSDNMIQAKSPKKPKDRIHERKQELCARLTCHASKRHSGGTTTRNMKVFIILLLALVTGGLARGQGTIVYSHFTPALLDFQSWDVNNDGTADFTLSQIWLQTADVPTSGMSYSFNVKPAPGNHVLGAGTTVVILPPDTAITPVPAPGQGWLHPQFGGLSVGSWSANLLAGAWSGWNGPMADVQEGFLGFRFVASDGHHFGWLRLQRSGGEMFPQITPVDFAWETRPDTMIAAGAVPEPGCFALLGVGGLVAWQRFGKRRKLRV